MYHKEFDPPPELRDAIKCFWYNKQMPAKELHQFEVQPDSYVEIIFHFGDISTTSQNGDLIALPSPFIIGLLNNPVIFHITETLEVIAIRCFPWAVFDFLGLQPDSALIQITDHPIKQLHPILNEFIKSGHIKKAIAKVGEFFLDINAKISLDKMLSKAGAAITNAKGNIPVSKVASEAHATVRTLERNFKQSSGHTVKDVSGLVRFEQVRNCLWTQPDTNLAALAHEVGYTDQAHLSREFKRYAGTTPAAFARKRKKENK